MRADIGADEFAPESERPPHRATVAPDEGAEVRRIRKDDNAFCGPATFCDMGYEGARERDDRVRASVGESLQPFE